MSYPTELYRLIHRGNPGDVDLYAQACEGAGSVLELGCGWGRVLGALVEPERVVVGLELSRAFAAQARRELPRAAHVVRGDMAAFAFRRRFERVIVPYSGLYNLPPAALASCLARIRAHLEPEGRLVFDVWTADAFHTEASPDDLAADALLPVVSVEHGGTTWDVFERSDWDRAARRVTSTYVYVARDGSDTREGTITHWYFLTDDIPRLLMRAGLEAIDLQSDDELTVVTARLSA